MTTDPKAEAATLTVGQLVARLAIVEAERDSWHITARDLLAERDEARSAVARVQALYGGEPMPVFITGTKVIRATSDRRSDLGAMVTESLLRVSDVRAALATVAEALEAGR